MTAAGLVVAAAVSAVMMLKYRGLASALETGRALRRRRKDILEIWVIVYGREEGRVGGGEDVISIQSERPVLNSEARR
jgi:hypothetical protein